MSASPAGKKEYTKDVLAILLSVALSLAVGEIAVRLIAANKLIYNIEMVKYAKELKMPDPRGVASHVHRPSASARLMGVEVTLNSLGNRSPELSAVKSPGVMRVLVLGSSVTMGWGVGQDQVFTALAEQKLNQNPLALGRKVEFANAGIGNYNTFFQLKLFERQYPLLHPDLVVLHYFISDAEERPKGNNGFLLKYSFLADLVYDQVNNFLFKLEGKKDLAKYYDDLYAGDSEPWKKTQGYVAEMAASLKKDHVPFLVMIVPDFHNLSENSSYKKIYEKIDTTFRSMGIPVFNMFAPFQEKYGKREHDLWIQADDPHPNALGQSEMADMLVEFLRQQLGHPKGK